MSQPSPIAGLGRVVLGLPGGFCKPISLSVRLLKIQMTACSVFCTMTMLNKFKSLITAPAKICLLNLPSPPSLPRGMIQWILALTQSLLHMLMLMMSLMHYCHLNLSLSPDHLSSVAEVIDLQIICVYVVNLSIIGLQPVLILIPLLWLSDKSQQLSVLECLTLTMSCVLWTLLKKGEYCHRPHLWHTPHRVCGCHHMVLLNPHLMILYLASLPHSLVSSSAIPFIVVRYLVIGALQA